MRGRPLPLTAVDDTCAESFASARTTLWRLLLRYPEIGVATVFLIFAAGFALAAPPFATLASATAILTVAAELGIVALGISFLMIAGEFDISVGSVLLISTLIFTTLANNGIDPALAFILTLAVCSLIGTLNGLITLRLQISSFITTLGSMMFWRGIHIYITSGFAVIYRADDSFLQFLGGNPFSMFRNTVIWFVFLALVLQFILVKTAYGNWVFATGGNAEAARNVGVPTSKVKVINFALASTLAGMAGITNLSRYHLSQAEMGMGKELEAIAAAVIGGTLLTGGRGSLVGTLIGALFMSMLRTGLIMMGISPYLYLPLTGVIIIGAVILNRTLAPSRA